MITKKFTPKRTACKVTFSYPSANVSTSVAVAGDFNEWDPAKGEMKLKGDTYSVTLSLKPSTDYKFKYVVDGSNWENDDAADSTVANEYGTQDSVVSVGE
jgi:1,4-alpha-glucan branching enzyme